MNGIGYAYAMKFILFAFAIVFFPCGLTALDIQVSKKLAEGGDKSAQSNLGLIYYNGEGVPKDNKEALKWFKMSADQGDAVGQFNLGVMYYNGEGVRKDNKEAVKWYLKAAEQGEAMAQALMVLLDSDFSTVEKHVRSKVKSYDTDQDVFSNGSQSYGSKNLRWYTSIDRS